MLVFVNIFMMCLSLSLIGLIISFVRGKGFIVLLYCSVPLILFIGVWALYLLLQSFFKSAFILINTNSAYITLGLLLIAFFTGFMYFRTSKKSVYK